MLTEEELLLDPEDVFTILGKIGEGSYGSVHKAIHNRTSTVIAIKMIPVENDLDESIKEISIMNGCESNYVVAFYGSYLKDTHLWIVMEYCAAGSVSDIMSLCRTTLNEAQIAVVCQYTLEGLSYLHSKRKIHRDIKAGNILINTKGEAKLADFGVAGQLTDAMSKRNTVIGTPFWMAPEVIQEVGYGVSADIWSLGITCIEMADGRPPYHNIHPMRAIFMIPTKPPPKLENEAKYTKPFKDFVARCLTKDPKERPTAEMLLEDPFITQAKGVSVLSEIVSETLDAIAKGGLERDLDDEDETTSSDSNDELIAKGLRTMKLVPASDAEGEKTIKFRKSVAVTSKSQDRDQTSAISSPTSSSPAASPDKPTGLSTTLNVSGDSVSTAGASDVYDLDYEEPSTNDDQSYSGTMVVNSRNPSSQKYDDTYKPEFMRNVKATGRDAGPQSSFDSSTIRPLKAPVGSTSAAAAAADAAIAAAKKKIMEADAQSYERRPSGITTEPPSKFYDNVNKAAIRGQDSTTPFHHRGSSSVEDLKDLLLEMEMNMEKEIQATKLKYEVKKAPIVEAIIAKGGTVSLVTKNKQRA